MRRSYMYYVLLLLLAFLVPDIRAQQLVANYPFNGKASDVTAFANHASVHGANLTQDRFGVANRASWFDGAQAGITAPNAPQLNSATTSVSFWVRVDELPAQGEVYLMSHGGWQERWKISLPSHGKPVWTTNHVGGISDMDSGDPTTALVPGTWTHVLFTHGMVNDEIYINGVLANSKAVGGALNSTTHDLGIGYNAVDGGNYMKGSIDEVQLYNHPFSAFEAQNLFNEQNTPP